MMGLSDSERISMMRSAVLTQSTRVTDIQTDGQTELAWQRASIYAVARKKTRVEYRDGLPITRLRSADGHRSQFWPGSAMIDTKPNHQH